MIFHHTGIAVESIDKATKIFELEGYSISSKLIVDEAQGVRVQFMEGPGPRIELVENLEGSNTITPWLSRGPRPYHHAYMVEDIENHEILGARQVSGLKSAPAFQFRRVTFWLTPGNWLIEIIEA